MRRSSLKGLKCKTKMQTEEGQLLMQPSYTAVGALISHVNHLPHCTFVVVFKQVVEPCSK